MLLPVIPVVDEVDVARVSMSTVSTVRLDLCCGSLKWSDRWRDLAKAHVGHQRRKPQGGAGGIVRQRRSGTRWRRRWFRWRRWGVRDWRRKRRRDWFSGGFDGERNTLIFRDEGGDVALFYSSMRFTRSLLEVIDTRASRSSDSNWQRRLTDVPHNSLESDLSLVFGFCVFFLCLVSKHKKILLNGFV